jgi:hypothetical protein
MVGKRIWNVMLAANCMRAKTSASSESIRLPLKQILEINYIVN